MFVSGTLKKKTIDFYREQIDDYDHEAFYVDEFTIAYNGEISTTPWNLEQLKKLERHQEKHIKYVLNTTEVLIKNAFFTKEIKQKLNNLLFLIQNTPRNITFILAETYHSVLKQYSQDAFNMIYNPTIISNNRPPIKIFIDDFQKLITYFEALKDLSQKNIETIISLFLKRQDYEIELEPLERKQNGICFLHDQDANLYALANFIAPERMKQVASCFNRGLGKDYSAICLYFLLKDKKLADESLSLHFQNPEKELVLSRVPSHLINLSKKHEPLF